MRRTVAVLALSALVLLSGCWKSAYGLMPASEMDSAPLSGVYNTVSDDGKTWHYEPVGDGKEFRLHSGLAGSPRQPGYRLGLDWLTEDFYLGQVLNGGGGMEGYLLIRISQDGRTVREHGFACDGQEASLSGVLVNGTDCTFKDYGILKAAAMARASQFSRAGVGARLVRTYTRN